MTTILQISDTHIVPEGQLVSGRLDTAGSLQKLITRIISAQDQIGKIDAVLVSGDVSDDGSAESYARFKALMKPLGLPLHVLPGNHDARAQMRAAFADRMPAQGPLNSSQRIDKVKLISLDSLVEGKGMGTLTTETLGFLRTSLEEANGAAILLALHHPPFRSGISFMDDIGLSNSGAFHDTLAGYPGEIRIVCGHIHSMMVTMFAGHITMSCPAPCSTFAFDSRKGTSPGFMALEDGCILHRWDSGFQSIRIGPVAGPGPYSF